jgi:CRISPR-associated endonuclease/helicase Cas3
MVLDLTINAPAPGLDSFESHPGKPLRVHTQGVLSGVLRRTASSTAIVAALFHDVGKLNPNFQSKLHDLDTDGYSNHAYLSAHSFLCFCKTNTHLLDSLNIRSGADVFAVVHAIARHHGDLADIKSILKKSEIDRMLKFLEANPNMPAAGYLQQWLPCSKFEILAIESRALLDTYVLMKDPTLDKIDDKLAYFMDQQFSFASLIEADKRDAGGNGWYKRDEDVEWASEHFAKSVSRCVDSLVPRNALDVVRTSIRNEAVSRLSGSLLEGQRVFSLTSPTGSGKTLTLLALAAAIRDLHPRHSIIYSIPFLSITEQVESVCKNEVFQEWPAFVSRIDSRTEDPELSAALQILDSEPDRIKEVLNRSFSNDTFDAGFVVTTFVQFFETLLSNRGAALIRLPNFSKSIFLVDEIQALPPRLYTFFVAYLHAFCQMVDSYAILSTATMPSFALPDASITPDPRVSKLFPGYSPPVELLAFEKYYSNDVFNRYSVDRIDAGRSTYTIMDLAADINKDGRSCLVILNTIDDTLLLYKALGDRAATLLNTRFILNDRKAKIDECKEALAANVRTILISTQLIEAGVDIDFPVVYRDMCPLPSLIQSAGRCNRNGNPHARGCVHFFELFGDDGKSRAGKVYRDRSDGWILDFSRSSFVGVIQEADLLAVQKNYFQLVNTNLRLGDHALWYEGQKSHDNLVKRISECAFETVGSFQLIDKDDFGQDYQIYVPPDDDCDEWARLCSLSIAITKASTSTDKHTSFEEVKRRRLEMDLALNRISGRIVQVRTRNASQLPPCEMRNGKVREVCGIRKLMLPEIDYSSETGIKLNGTGTAIL